MKSFENVNAERFNEFLENYKGEITLISSNVVGMEFDTYHDLTLNDSDKVVAIKVKRDGTDEYVIRETKVEVM